MFNRTVTTAIALGIVTISAIPANAQPVVETTSHVASGDLDLGSEAGRRQLDRRLGAAVRKVCGIRPNVRDIHEVRDYRSCVVSAHMSYETERQIALNAAQANPQMAENAQSTASNAG